MAPARLLAQPASRKISESHLGNKLQAASENSVCSAGPGPKCKPYHRQCSSSCLHVSVLRVHRRNGAGARPACLPYTCCRNQRHGGRTFLNELCGRVCVCEGSEPVSAPVCGDRRRGPRSTALCEMGVRRWSMQHGASGGCPYCRTVMAADSISVNVGRPP